MNKSDIKDAVLINGTKCLTKQSLFTEFSKKLNFPDYFGYNWDAFEEILYDIELPVKVIVFNFDDILKQDNEQRIIFDEIIQKFNFENENQFYKITSI